MTLKYCPISPILNCNLSESSCKNCKYKGLHFLQDEKNKKFPFKRFENYTEIYNSVKTNLFSNIKELLNSNIGHGFQVTAVSSFYGPAGRPLLASAA